MSTPANLVHALESLAKFHLADDPSAQVEYMDTSEELYARWVGAYIRRDWFLQQFSAEQRAVLANSTPDAKPSPPSTTSSRQF
jgi:hypothetical protein